MATWALAPQHQDSLSALRTNWVTKSLSTDSPAPASVLAFKIIYYRFTRNLRIPTSHSAREPAQTSTRQCELKVMATWASALLHRDSLSALRTISGTKSLSTDSPVPASVLAFKIIYSKFIRLLTKPTSHSAMEAVRTSTRQCES